MPSVLIVGGGVAGLAAALALGQRGIECEIVEIQPRWNTHGTGLFTPANGVDALRRLGIGDAAVAAGVPIWRRDFATGSGKRVMSLDMEHVWGEGHFSLGIARAALHDVLVEALGDIPITMGSTVAQIREVGEKVQVDLTGGDVRTFDWVVGADGAHSKVRSLTLGEVDLRRVMERTCRYLTARPVGVENWTLRGSRDGTILLLPVSEHEAYVYAQRRDRVASASKADWIAPFAEFAEPVPSALGGWDAESAYWNSLDELAPIPCWGRGRVVLIGDAAHAMPPFMAQGAALAFEDALALAEVATSNGLDANVAETLTGLRSDRVDWVRNRNRRREKLTRVPFPLTVIGARLTGVRTWTEDYRLLRP